MQLTHTYIKSYALSALKRAQAEFNKHPNSRNWCAVTTAMLVHQQVLAVRLAADAERLCDKLTPLTLGEWPAAIVDYTTGQTIKQVLALN
jgi:hypothetical protein